MGFYARNIFTQLLPVADKPSAGCSIPPSRLAQGACEGSKLSPPELQPWMLFLRPLGQVMDRSLELVPLQQKLLLGSKLCLPKMGSRFQAFAALPTGETGIQKERYIYINVYMHIYIYVYTYIEYIDTCIQIRRFMGTDIKCRNMYIYLYTCMYKYSMSMCTLYVYVYIHIHIRLCQAYLEPCYK